MQQNDPSVPLVSQPNPSQEMKEFVPQQSLYSPPGAAQPVMYFYPAEGQQPMMYYPSLPPPPLPTPVEPIPGMPLLPLGVSGLPQARPRFSTPGEDGIRHPQSCCFQSYNPGPNIPLHWYDGGYGWVTKYFYDVTPRNPATYTPGTFRCQVRRPDGHLCNEEAEEDDCCKGTCCWHESADAPINMAFHLLTTHQIQPPPRREWSTGLFDTQGCCDVLFCVQCNGARQMMALSGWEEEMHCGWCMFFTFLSCRVIGRGRYRLVIVIPPWIYVALYTRPRLVALNNIDEGWCTTIMTLLFCAPCSVAQTHRELAASGVWAGSMCVKEKPNNYGSIGAPKNNLHQMMMM